MSTNIKSLRPLRAIVSAAMLFATATPSLSDSQIIGRASVIDGDTIEIHNQRIRFEGIDAPESRQTCNDPSGAPWRCGRASAFALADKIGTATVTCQAHGRDRYKRALAICFLSDEDLNAWMVQNGWAVAYRKYSTDYVEQEDQARQSEMNIWAGSFEMPWDWRRSN